MTPNTINSAGNARFLVTLIFLVGLAMAVAASVQLALRADEPTDSNNSLSLSITFLRIVEKNDREFLQIHYKASALGPQSDKSRVSLYFEISDAGQEAHVETVSTPVTFVEYPLDKFVNKDGSSLAQAVNLRVTGYLNQIELGHITKSVKAEKSGSRVALKATAPSTKQEAATRPNSQPAGQPVPVLPDEATALGLGQAAPPTTTEFDPDKQPVGKALAPTEFGLMQGLGRYATNIMKYALPLGIALAIIMTIYAGILFMLSQGQPDRIKDAQEIIQGAILGLVVLIMARFMVNFLILPGSEPVDSGPIVAPEEQSL